MSADANSDQWRRCSSCKKPISFGAHYYVCNVSTCNRGGNKGFVFCTVSCWDAHLGIVRHRESWAVDAKAPTRREYERSQQQTPKAASKPKADKSVPREPRRVIAQARAPVRKAEAASEALPEEILIVVSKLKNYVKAKSGISCSDRVAGPLSDAVRALCDDAIENALADERKTLLERDFKRR
ncbi:MAG: hypothetical protein GY944_03650 [bacterium]|nr:hypothetical protein [bacterium]